MAEKPTLKTSTIWVNHMTDDGELRTLMHLHENEGIWLPPGGKVEPLETQYDAALRELEEETGLTTDMIAFISGVIDTGDKVRPFWESPLPHLQAVDYGFLAVLASDVIEIPGFRWLSASEFEHAKTNQNVRDITRHSFELVQAHVA